MIILFNKYNIIKSKIKWKIKWKFNIKVKSDMKILYVNIACVYK